MMRRGGKKNELVISRVQVKAPGECNKVRKGYVNRMTYSSTI
jgi:hypothetical protein